jgi:hypothetical protein
MSDDENRVTDLGRKKDPYVKVKEEFEKEWNTKLSEQRKKTVAAGRIFHNEKKALEELEAACNEERETLASVLSHV